MEKHSSSTSCYIASWLQENISPWLRLKAKQRYTKENKCLLLSLHRVTSPSTCICMNAYWWIQEGQGKIVFSTSSQCYNKKGAMQWDDGNKTLMCVLWIIFFSYHGFFSFSYASLISPSCDVKHINIYNYDLESIAFQNAYLLAARYIYHHNVF